MEIIKSKRKSKCRLCLKTINQKYKVSEKAGWTARTRYYYHLSCYFRHLKNTLEHTKKQLKQFSKQKLKKQMILESLER